MPAIVGIWHLIAIDLSIKKVLNLDICNIWSELLATYKCMYAKKQTLWLHCSSAYVQMSNKVSFGGSFEFNNVTTCFMFY